MGWSGDGGVEMGERAQAGLEVPIAESNSTESMKIFFFLWNKPECSDLKEEAGKKGGGGGSIKSRSIISNGVPTARE